MGSPTMSMQSPQTGGKSGQAPGQAGGKGFGGGGFQGGNTPPTQDMMSNFQQQNMQQADGNMGMGAPLQAMNQAQPMGLNSPGQDMLGSGLGQSTNPYQSNLSQPPSTGSFNPNNLPQSSMIGNLGGSQQNSLQQQMGGQQQMGLGKPTQAPDNPNPAGGKGMAGMGQGNVTYPSQSGQPMMGMPNAYSNTVGQPNSFSEQGSMYKGGKGTGGSSGNSGA